VFNKVGQLERSCTSPGARVDRLTRIVKGALEEGIAIVYLCIWSTITHAYLKTRLLVYSLKGSIVFRFLKSIMPQRDHISPDPTPIVDHISVEPIAQTNKVDINDTNGACASG
jgi:hypothetical protein